MNVGYHPEGANLNIAYPRDRTTSGKVLAMEVFIGAGVDWQGGVWLLGKVITRI